MIQIGPSVWESLLANGTFIRSEIQVNIHMILMVGFIHEAFVTNVAMDAILAFMAFNMGATSVFRGKFFTTN